MTQDVTKYFAGRAPRYTAALKACPGARVLDALPYVAVVAGLRGTASLRDARICDAFGGTGFLSQALRNTEAAFVVCDASAAMLRGAQQQANTTTFVTSSDFADVLDVYGERSFSFVFSHGGLHHVADARDQETVRQSRFRQQQIVRRLARLVAPSGALVIADIPDSEPSERSGTMSTVRIGRGDLRSAMGAKQFEMLTAALGVLPDALTLNDLRRKLETLWTDVRFPVPRSFFDTFVRTQTPMGHEAVYPRFEDIDDAATGEGLRADMRINYRGPWLFNSTSEAGWFFREKFSVGAVSPPGVDLATETKMVDAISSFLGVATRRERSPRAAEAGLDHLDMVAVNWGVSYAVYTRA